MHLFGTHFGTYEVVFDEEREPFLQPFRFDQNASAVGAHFLDLARSPQRTTQPMVRAGWLENPGRSDGRGRGREPFVAVDWDTAIGLVASELDRVRTQYENKSIYAGSYGWSSAGRFHHAQSQLKRFLNLIGGFTFSRHSYSYGTAEPLIPHLIGPEYASPGRAAPSWSDIAANAQIMLCFGGFRISNAQIQAGGTGQHQSAGWIAVARQNGCRIIVLSPSKGDLAGRSDIEHHFIRPNTDTAVMLAMAETLLSEGLVDEDFISRCTVGYDIFRAYLDGSADGTRKSPQWAQAISGLSAETIRSIARLLRNQLSLVDVAWSLQRARFGEQPYWAALALASMAGHVGKPGCGFAYGLTSTDAVAKPVRKIVGPSIDQGINPINSFIPVSRITELLENPGESINFNGSRLELPEIRLIYWAGGNPFHHHQDLNRLRKAWERPDTIVVNDSVCSGTARLADVVFPAALAFERNDLVAGSDDNWIIASKQVMPPLPTVKTDHEIFAALAARMGIEPSFTEGLSEMEWLERLYQGYQAANPELPDFDEFWSTGFAALGGTNVIPHSNRFLADFVADPDKHPLRTPSGRITIFSETIAGFGYRDCPGHPSWIEPEEWLGAKLAERYPLHLLSPQPETRLHSQLEAATPSQKARVAGREPILLNEDDAKARGIHSGDLVLVYNERGRCLAGAIVSSDIGPRVAVLATGATFDPSEDNEMTERGGNPNVLTPDQGSSLLSQGASPNSCLVQVIKADPSLIGS